MLITRRKLVTGLGSLAIGGLGLGSYALAEPWRLSATRYQVTPQNWTPGLKLRIAALADIHACDPWMSLDRIADIVDRTNALQPDLVALLGDFVAGTRIGRLAQPVPHADLARCLAGLKAPLGTHAILGNHDWWEDKDLQDRRAGPTRIGQALERAGIRVYENEAVRLEKQGQPFWLAGLGDQWAFWPNDRKAKFRRMAYEGVDDLPATLAAVTDDAPVILMIHEPDAFVEVPDRVSLTFAGHTHGGQVQMLGYAPIVPSKYGRRFLYGHIVENGRHLIVSGGLGCSGVPVRFGRPPEIVLVELSATAGV